MPDDKEMQLIYEGSGVGDTLTIEPRFENKAIMVEINAPWYGSTEIGFGATIHFYLAIKDARHMVAALQAWLDKQPQGSDDA